MSRRQLSTIWFPYRHRVASFEPMNRSSPHHIRPMDCSQRITSGCVCFRPDRLPMVRATSSMSSLSSHTLPHLAAGRPTTLHACPPPLLVELDQNACGKSERLPTRRIGSPLMGWIDCPAWARMDALTEAMRYFAVRTLTFSHSAIRLAGCPSAIQRAMSRSSSVRVGNCISTIT